MAGPHAGNRNRPAYSGQSRFRFPKQIIELFAPRKPLEFKPPPKRRKLPPMTGLAAYISKFGTVPEVPKALDVKLSIPNTPTRVVEPPEDQVSSAPSASHSVLVVDPGASSGSKALGAACSQPVPGDAPSDKSLSVPSLTHHTSPSSDPTRFNSGTPVQPAEQAPSALTSSDPAPVAIGGPAPSGTDSAMPIASGTSSSAAKPGKTSVSPRLEDSFETPAVTRKRKRSAALRHVDSVVKARTEEWDPFSESGPRKTREPYNTLFVSGFPRDTLPVRLHSEFENYGPVVDVIMPRDHGGVPRGYAFVEFEHEADLKIAYKEARGRKIDGRRIIVDVERGRTVKNWRPNRLDGPNNSCKFPKVVPVATPRK